MSGTVLAAEDTTERITDVKNSLSSLSLHSSEQRKENRVNKTFKLPDSDKFCAEKT